MAIIRETLHDIFQTAHGFFRGFFLVMALAIGLYLYQHHWDEMSELPIVQGLTDTYLLGLNSVETFSEQAILRFYEMEEHQEIRTNPALNDTDGPSVGLAPEPGGRIIVQTTWRRDSILRKLENAGFSRRKMQQAGHFLDYIEQHRDLALRDMYQKKVPASVKLAQALLESDAGRSHLARHSNNQFGIKALPGQRARQKIRAGRYEELRDGDFTFLPPAVGVFNTSDDHHYDRFEVYNTVGDSYERHTSLLSRPCRMGDKGCYQWIWEAFPIGRNCDIREAADNYYRSSGIAAGDFFNGRVSVPYYAACAAGLKMAGYATSKQYHKKLAYIIETYDLWRFDLDLVRALAQENSYSVSR